MNLRRALREVLAGKNVDVLLVLAISIVAIALSVFGVAQPNVVAALTVTALGTLGVSMLQQRFAVDDAVKEIRQVLSGARFQETPPYDLHDVLEKHSIVMIAGVDLARTFSNFESALVAFLQAGKELRVMLYDHEAMAVEYAVIRSKRPFSKERQIGLIKGAIADFSQLLDVPQAKVEIRLSAAPFTFGVVAGDYRDQDGFICLKYYAYRLDRYDRPWLRVTAADGRWYAQFRDEIDVLWTDARKAEV